MQKIDPNHVFPRLNVIKFVPSREKLKNLTKEAELYCEEDVL